MSPWLLHEWQSIYIQTTNLLMYFGTHSTDIELINQLKLPNIIKCLDTTTENKEDSSYDPLMGYFHYNSILQTMTNEGIEEDDDGKDYCFGDVFMVISRWAVLQTMKNGQRRQQWQSLTGLDFGQWVSGYFRCEPLSPNEKLYGRFWKIRLREKWWMK